MMLRNAALLASLLLLVACGGRPVGPAPTISALPRVQQPVPVVNPRISFKIDRDRVISAYRELVQITPRDGSYGRELQRLADLELESSIDKRLSSEPAEARLGEEESRLAIERYQLYLETWPGREDNDRILYQLARAYAMDSQIEASLQVMDRLVRDYPQSEYIDEVQFRRGENLFVDGDFDAAEAAYGDIVANHPRSEYFEKALYKYGWAQFKQNEYEPALDSFIKLLDGRNRRRQINEIELSSRLDRATGELLNDVVRVVSLTFSYLPQKQPISHYFNRNGNRSYEPLLYLRLGELYLSKQRVTDAVEIFVSYGENHPFSPFAPELHSRAIDAIGAAGFSELLLAEKEGFIRKYNKGTAFWEQQDKTMQERLQPILTRHMADVATHYHALARASKKPADYRRAADSYRRYLTAFPQDENAAQMNFLLAESLYDARQVESAVTEYEKTAYQYPTHKNSAEAGYAAILGYSELFKRAPKEKQAVINEQLIQSSLRFSEVFVDDKRMPGILMKTVEQFFDLAQYDKAQQYAQRLVDNEQLEAKMRHNAWIIIAHSQFRLQRYDAAENAYRNVLEGVGQDRKARGEMREQLALSIYRQGELARQQGQHQAAAEHFLRVGKNVPESSKRIVADYDAATEYITLKDWPAAIALLEGFRKKYPRETKWQQGVGEKLALAYTSTGQHGKSAAELMKLVSVAPQAERQDMMWQAAELYQQAGDEKQAVAVYKTYLKSYPNPFPRAIELRHKIAEYYRAQKDARNHRYWLNELIKADNNAGKQRTDRSRYLAATATLELVKPVHESFRQARLTVPLKKSLNKKKELMKSSIDAYTRAAKYQVEEVTTTATFNIAEIYREFATALLKSERPRNLNADELEEYNYLLEDQAYPFEEKAIDIHEQNITRIPGGSWDESIRNSLAALGKLLPFRYAKSEVTDGFVVDE